MELLRLWARSVISRSKAKEIRHKEEQERILTFIKSSSEEEIVNKIHELENALLWREFRYKHDKTEKHVIEFDMNPRDFKMITRERWNESCK